MKKILKQSQKEIWIIVFAFLILIVFSIASRLTALHEIKKINQVTSIITEHPLQVSNAALDLEVNIFQFRQEMVHIVFFKNHHGIQTHIDRIHAYEKKAMDDITLIKKQILGEKGQKLALETERLFIERQIVREVVIHHAIHGEMDKAKEIFLASDSSYLALNKSVFQLYGYARAKAAYYQKRADKLYADFETKNLYTLIILIVIFITLAVYVVHRVANYLYSNEKISKDLALQTEELNQLLIKQKIREQEFKEQAAMFDALEDSIFIHDLEGRFLYANENAWKTRGYTYDELMQMSIHELDAPEYDIADPDRIRKAIIEMKQKGYIRARVEHICKNGERLPVEVNAKLVMYHSQECILSSVRDISAQIEANQEIQKLSKVLEQIDDSVMVTDKHGTITYVNHAFCEHTGYSLDEVLGNNPRILKSGHHDAAFYKNLWTIILHGDVFRVTMINRKKNGDLFYDNKTITPLKKDNNEVYGFVSSGKDVTAETMMNLEIERQATIDKLTGIYNRNKFEELFTTEAERFKRFGEPLSLIIIDIDHFKRVNDTMGHDVGDEVLKRLAEIIKENIRQIDIFARWGGEEFLILSPNTDIGKVKVLAEKLRIAVGEGEFPHSLRMTISQGISTFRENDSFAEFFKRADEGLYHAKAHGRDQVVCMDEPLGR